MEKIAERQESPRLYEKYRLINSEFLKLSSEEIIKLDLPSKIKRRLLLKKMGMPIDETQHFFPADFFRNNSKEIIDNFRSIYGWEDVGVNTAVYSPEDQISAGSSPMVIFFNDGSKLINGKKEESDETLDIASAVDKAYQDETFSFKRSERDQFFAYDNKLFEGRPFIACTIVFESNPYNVSPDKGGPEKVNRIFRLAMQLGTGHRSIGIKKENFMLVTKDAISLSPKVDESVSNKIDPENAEMFEDCRRQVLSFIASRHTKEVVEDLSRLTGYAITFEINWCDGEIMVIDFHTSPGY